MGHTQEKDLLSVGQIESILGKDSALVLGAIKADVDSMDMFDVEQVMQDYRDGMQIMFDYLVVALRAALPTPTSCTGCGGCAASEPQVAQGLPV